LLKMLDNAEGRDDCGGGVTVISGMGSAVGNSVDEGDVAVVGTGSATGRCE
jgi:hypothetical protein